MDPLVVSIYIYVTVHVVCTYKGGHIMSRQFDSIYSSIVQHSGLIFSTKTGRPFVYQIEKGMLVVNRTDYKVHAKSNIRKALDLMPASRPSRLNGKVRMPSYIWAILNDPRIKNGKDVPGKWHPAKLIDRSILPDYSLGALFQARRVNGKVEIKSDSGLTQLFLTKEVAKKHFEVIHPN